MVGNIYEANGEGMSIIGGDRTEKGIAEKTEEAEDETKAEVEDKAIAFEDMTYAELVEVLRGKMHDEIEYSGSIDEDEILSFLSCVSGNDKDRECDWKTLMEKMIDISYRESINDFSEYLYVVMAKKVLPDEITGYETIEHIFSKMLPDVKNKVDELSFHASSIGEFLYALQIISYCGDEIGMEVDEGYEKVFQSVGIKYKTVKSFISRAKR